MYQRLFACLLSYIALGTAPLPEWGFFGHRRINQLAVFTLPPPMIGQFKEYLDYLTEHAVDPDKRRYATKHEAVRHYIDLDRWPELPPRNWTTALAMHTPIWVTNNQGDTLLYPFPQLIFKEEAGGLASQRPQPTQYPRLRRVYQAWFNRNILPQYYEDAWTVHPDSLAALHAQLPEEFTSQWSTTWKQAWAADSLSGHGILPWHLVRMQQRITDAMKQRDADRIWQLCAEMGHYIGDAHVPLHTTSNYNGQQTGQTGIHAFWESRIPELLADKEYDFWVGQASYINDPQTYYWEMVLASNKLVEQVLATEKALSLEFPPDQQYCQEMRGQVLMRMPCPAYARAWSERMGDMVESRMRAAILAIGSSWYTAWIDAGQPDLSQGKVQGMVQFFDSLPQAPERSTGYGRDHE
jgi:hypothetical protein